MDKSIYDRDDVKRSIARIDARHERVESGEDVPECELWVRDDGALFTLESGDRLDGGTCIYSIDDGGKLIE